MMAKLPSGEPLSVIFLDTEGWELLFGLHRDLIVLWSFLQFAQGLLLAIYRRPTMPRYSPWQLC